MGMGRTTLVIGGSGSGKSEFAEDYLLAHSRSQRIYVATMQPFDEECIRRIEKHRKMRAKKQFLTIECYTHLEEMDVSAQIYCQKGKTYDILLECISNLLANEMYAEGGRKDGAKDAIVSGIRRLQEQSGRLVVVSNDVFSDGMDYDDSTTCYMEQLGLLNRELAALSDEVVEVVAGCPIFYKRK